MKRLVIPFVLLLVAGSSRAVGQPGGQDDQHTARIGVSAGMGVNFHDAGDIVERINGSGIVTQRLGDFKSGVEFFGALTIPFSADWVAKAEYVYLLASYSLNSGFGIASEFLYTIHMPSLIAQYLLFGASTYDLKAGIGAGYHWGTYEEKFFGTRYSAHGIGTLLELEGNTALGENLYAHLGVQTRWDFIGELKDGQGKSPFQNASPTTLHFFSVGARLGMTYYF